MPAAGTSQRQLLVHACTVAVVCVLAGLLSLWFSPVTFGFPLVWLPAGVGLAATLRLGPAAWPGIFLGSIVLALLHGRLSGAPSDPLLTMVDGGLVGVALCVQSVLAARLLQSPGGASPALDSIPGVVRFGVFYSPLAALMGGAGVLLGGYTADALPGQDVLRPAVAAWFGQWMGMVFATAAVFFATGAEAAAARARRNAVFAATVLALGVAFLLGGAIASLERQREQHAFSEVAEGIVGTMVAEFDDIRDAVASFRSFFEAARPVDEKRFRQFAESVRRRVPGVDSAGWAPRVEGNHAAFEAAVRASLLPSFRISGPLIVPQGAELGVSDTAYPVLLVDSVESEQVRGFDLQRSPGHREQIDRARATGDVLAFPPRRTVVGQPGELSLIFIASVRPAVVIPGLPDPEGLIGVSAQPLPMVRRLIELDENGTSRVHFLLRDVTGSEPVVLVDLGAAPVSGTGIAPFQRRLEVAGRIWDLTLQPTAGFVAAQDAGSPFLLEAATCLFSAVLLLSLLVSSGHAARLESQFEERTAELGSRNRQLRNEIAEREAAEQRESETQRSFHDGLSFAGIGSWDHDLETGRLTGTAELCRIYGLPGTSFAMDLDTLLERVHPDDLPRYQEALEACAVSGGFLSLDLRIMHPGGEMRWISARARHRTDKAGRPHVVGVSWDITERVESASRAKLLAMAFERGGEAIFIADPELRVIEVNPAFTGLTGISEETAAGIDAAELFSERGNRELFRTHAAIALDLGTWQGEVWGRGPGGVPRPFWLVLAVVRDTSGQPSNYIGSFVDISERKGAEEKIEFLAHHDALTGLPNRFSLQSRVDQALSQVVRSGERLALMFIDMDRFKLINDSLGHDVGDQLLLEIARRLRANVRSSDIVARLGGDEFVVALPGAGDDEAIARMAEKLRQELNAPYTLRSRLLHTSPSIGIAIAPEHGATVEMLMRNADAAMYRAKDLGRNNFQFFDRALSERARERLELAADLRAALERDEFRLHFQPQVRAEDGACVAAEALIRWQHPERGMIAPDRFIGVAEEFGLIDAIGEWALNAACRELAELNARGISGLRICVNLSAKQLRDRELPERVAGAIAAAGVAPGDLELELTESMAMQDPQSTISLLKRLYDSGVGLAIDDFGTGYSSLSYLKMLPLHNIKLDRSFVRDIDAEPGGRAICSATVALAHALGIKVVAEGVETEVQRDFLMALGCDYLQGWLFSKALPGPDLALFIAARRREFGA